MWEHHMRILIMVATAFVCSAGSQETSFNPGYDSASKTIRLQKCQGYGGAGNGDDIKIPKLLYDLKTHPKHAQVHRYYNETRFLHIDPVGMSFDGNFFTCPNETLEQNFSLWISTKPRQQRFFLQNGYLRLYDDALNITSYIPPTLYCLDSVYNDLVTGRACIPNENSTFPRFRRCRKSFPNFLFKFTYHKNGSNTIIDTDVVPKQNTDTWDIYRDSRFPLNDITRMQLPFYYHKDLACKGKHAFVVSDPKVLRTTAFSELWYTDIRVTREGKLEGRNSGSEHWRPLHIIMHGKEFCIEKGYVTLASSSDETKKVEPEYQRFILNCPPVLGPPTLMTIYHYFILVAILFLLATLIVYALVWTELTVHAKIAAGFVSSMFLVFLSLYLNNLSVFKVRSRACVANGMIQHFFALTMYSWMAVMNYDVWEGLTSLQNTTRDRSTKKLLIYCLITYGSAGIIVIVSVILHFSYELDMEKIVHPQYGFWACYINFSVYNYYFLPGTLIAFAVSLCFCLLTCKTLIEWSKNRKKLTMNKDANSRDSYAFFLLVWILAMKVFILSGISWGLDITYSAIHGQDDEITVGWWLIDIYNLLQAAALFWILVVKQETRSQLCKKYKMAEHIFQFWDRHFAEVRGTQTSRTSQRTVSSSAGGRGSDEPSISFAKA